MTSEQLSFSSANLMDVPQALLRQRIRFEIRPAPVPSELRIALRLASLILALRLCCRNYRTSLHRLQVLNWALRLPSARATLLAAVGGTKRPEDVLVRYEPAFARIVAFAAAEGLVASPAEKRIELTSMGEALAEEVLAAPECLVPEKSFLLTVGLRVTEDWVNRLIRIAPGL